MLLTLFLFLYFLFKITFMIVHSLSIWRLFLFKMGNMILEGRIFTFLFMQKQLQDTLTYDCNVNYYL
jgi:hypothetical protein